MKILMIVSLLMAPLFLVADVKEASKNGKSFGKQQSKISLEKINTIDPNDLLPEDQKGKVFDPKSAKHSIKNGDEASIKSSVQSEEIDFLLSKEVQNNTQNKHLHADERFIKNGDLITEEKDKYMNTSEEILEVEYQYEKCRQSADPFPVFISKALEVDVFYQPQEIKKTTLCLGHKSKEEFSKNEKAKKEKKRLKKQFSKDPTIKSFTVKIDEEGFFSKSYKVKASWSHKNNTETCSKYKTKKEVLQEEMYEERGEKWVYEDESLFNLTDSPLCTLIESRCVDQSPKIISGKEIHRQCWKESLSYLCKFQNCKNCSFLRSKNCDEISRKCVKESPFGCAEWEINFRCISKIKKKIKNLEEGDIYGSDVGEWEAEYDPNDSFEDVCVKLAVFDEMKKEMEASQLDASSVQVFKAKKRKCRKNIADDILYDCCFSFSGLAQKVELAKCNSEEIALAEMNDKGLCHYVGKHENKTLGIRTSDDHVFCCFSSKLARVVQEEGRKQLKINWGTSKHPNCSGFTTDQIANLNFSQLDLSEVYDQAVMKTQNIDDKLNDFQQKLSNRIEEKIEEEGGE